jgi:hypothetical protein
MEHPSYIGIILLMHKLARLVTKILSIATDVTSSETQNELRCCTVSFTAGQRGKERKQHLSQN